MGGPRNAGCIARFSEVVAKGFFRKRIAGCSRLMNVRSPHGRASKCPDRGPQDWERHRQGVNPVFSKLHDQDAALYAIEDLGADVLPACAIRVTTAQTRYRRSHPSQTRSLVPIGQRQLVSRHVFLGPFAETRAFLALWIFDAGVELVSKELRFNCPSGTARAWHHGSCGLEPGRGAPVPASRDVCAGDGRITYRPGCSL